MNAPSKITVLSDAVVRATEQANCWRCWMVNQFARGERLIVEALLRADEKAKIPTVLKQRIDRLRPMVDDECKAALDQFLELADGRNALAHGDGLITVDRKGQWMLRLTHYDRDGRTLVALFEPEANEMREKMRAANAALKNCLTS
jgi:hypothetical protein